ncbi:MAG TPA: hypothetical protein VF516_04095 [Kofleriaceae bacterium]
MIDLQREVNRTVQGFVAQIVELVHHTAVETLQTAFVGAGAAERSGERGPIAAGTSAKRTQADLQALSQRLAAFVQANPGLRIAQINQALGTKTKDLMLPIRKLTASGVIRTTGEKRTTRYFAIPGPALEQELAPRPEPEADAPRIEPPRDPPTRPAGEPVVVRAGASAPSEPDAGWQRCLADVFTLAQRLAK